MGWHAEASDADLNWPAGHSAQAPSSFVDPVSPLVAESLLHKPNKRLVSAHAGDGERVRNAKKVGSLVWRYFD